MNPVIYFISAGTSSNDLGKSGKDNLSYFGYKELCKLRENNYFKKYILSDNNNEIYTSAARNCVESSLILFSDITQKKVNIVPYLSNKKDKNTNHIQLFKRNLDNSHNKHILQTLDFGKNHTLQTLVKQLPKILVDLKTNIKNYSFNASKFISKLEQKIKTTKGNIVIICHSSLIKDILRKLSSSEYKGIKHESFENSSIWEVKFNIEPISNKIIYELFSKKYPIPNNYEPLKYDETTDKYLCEFKGYYIPLFEKSSDISKNLLKKISDSSISKSNNIKKNFIDDEPSINSKNNSKKNVFNIVSSYVG
jgi:hypothetical protein